METTTLLLLLLAFETFVIIPLILIFPPKALLPVRSAVQRRRNMRVVRSVQMSDKNWTKENIYRVPSGETVLIVFCNKKSGGNQGARLLAMMKRILPPKQIFDLSEVNPAKIIQQFSPDSANVRIVAAGGDGTVAWLVGACRQLGKRKFAIGIIPLGTGNDLARMLGWGSGVANSSTSDADFLVERIARIATAHPLPFDIWDVQIESGKNGAVKREATLINYFSIGLDAEIAMRFHKERAAAAAAAESGSSSSPASSQAESVLRYARLGFESSFSSTPLGTAVVSLRAGDEQSVVDFDFSVQKCLIFSNVPLYQGGSDFWGAVDGISLQDPLHDHNRSDSAAAATDADCSGDQQNFKEVDVSDGLMECMSLSGALHTGLTHLALDNAIRVSQSNRFELTLNTGSPITMQLDGEPSLLPAGPCKVTFSRSDQFPMLECVTD